jgi:phospho-N-acetylmuramoyl-pentapeptide-transferase
VPANAALLTVANTQRGLEDLARASRARSHAQIVAVTGSAGKTTTKEMLRLALARSAAPMRLGASYNNHWGVPLSLAAMPQRCAFGVFEVGMNHFGEIRALVGLVRPHVALVTTIAPAHLEFFGQCDAIADAKSEIFEGIVSGGAALVPADSPYAERLRRRAPPGPCEPDTQLRPRRELRCTPSLRGRQRRRHESSVAESWAARCISGSALRVRTMRANAVAALLAVAASDGDVLNAAAALSAFSALKGRGERFDLTVGSGMSGCSTKATTPIPRRWRRPSPIWEPRRRRGASPSWATCSNWATKAMRCMPTLPSHRRRARRSCVPVRRTQMAALWEKIPPSRRGAYGAKSADIVEPLLAAPAGRRSRVGEGFVRQPHGGGCRCAEIARGGLMFHYFLVPLSEHIGVLNVFRYITFRTGGAVATALLIAFWLGPRTIAWLRVRQGKGQPIRSDGPQRHVVEKQGTPTMGGLIILVPSLVATLVVGRSDRSLCLDRALRHGEFRAAGLCGRLSQSDQTFVGRRCGPHQAARAIRRRDLATFAVMQLEDPTLSGALTIPFFKTVLVPLGWGFLAFGALVIVGASNAVNLTDGLDGLAIVPVMIAAADLRADRLSRRQREIRRLSAAPLCRGHGRTRRVPCRADRGRVGLSLVQRAARDGVHGRYRFAGAGRRAGRSRRRRQARDRARDRRRPFRDGSGVGDRAGASFKLTGKRVFRMAPIHHHFEQLGWKEPTIVIRFWIIAVVLALVGLATLKLR